MQGVREEIDGIVIDVFGQSLLNGEHQGGHATLLPAFGEALGVGVNGGFHLLVQ